MDEETMSMDQYLQTLPADSVLEVPRWAANQRHVIIKDEKTLFALIQWLHDARYVLYTLTATDNRLLVDRTYKIYYLFSAPREDELVLLEYGLPRLPPGELPSIAGIYPNAEPFEHKIRDLFGLQIKQADINASPGFLLHTEAGYPPSFAPLSRRQTLTALKDRLPQALELSQMAFRPSTLPEGMFVVPVGPVHAGVIEPGHFPFHVGGEVVEKVPVTLGFKHRGVEKLFETHHTLLDGWELAEKVSGDTAVAHTVAYCQAVEDLAQVELPLEIHQWRAFLLELERAYHHISDIGHLAGDIAYERAAAPLLTLRELFLHFINRTVSDHRFLRGLNQPGKVMVRDVIPWDELSSRLMTIIEEALEQGRNLLELPTARDRMLNTGVLSQEEARYATGMAARASGWLHYDFRCRHPSPAYGDQEIQELLKQTILAEGDLPTRHVPVYEHDLQGDVYARLAIRVAELETSQRLLKKWLPLLQHIAPVKLQVDIKPYLEQQPEMTLGIGYAEGWRGTVIYFVFKGYQNTIARCDVCDPSLVNWHIFEKAVIPETEPRSENILADFPLINKSFNLSYAGHDL